MSAPTPTPPAPEPLPWMHDAAKEIAGRWLPLDSRDWPGTYACMAEVIARRTPAAPAGERGSDIASDAARTAATSEFFGPSPYDGGPAPAALGVESESDGIACENVAAMLTELLRRPSTTTEGGASLWLDTHRIRAALARLRPGATGAHEPPGSAESGGKINQAGKDDVPRDRHGNRPPSGHLDD